MESMDIGNYFFAGHPRERVGVKEQQKFFFFQFILLIVGFTSPNLKKYKKKERSWIWVPWGPACAIEKGELDEAELWFVMDQLVAMHRGWA